MTWGAPVACQPADVGRGNCPDAAIDGVSVSPSASCSRHCLWPRGFSRARPESHRKVRRNLAFDAAMAKTSPGCGWCRLSRGRKENLQRFEELHETHNELAWPRRGSSTPTCPSSDSCPDGHGGHSGLWGTLVLRSQIHGGQLAAFALYLGISSARSKRWGESLQRDSLHRRQRRTDLSTLGHGAGRSRIRPGAQSWLPFAACCF